MIRKSMCVFVERVGGENKTSTRSQKISLGLAEWGTKQREVSGTQARWLDTGGPQAKASVPRHWPASVPQHTFHRSSGCPGSTGTAARMACTQEAWYRVQRQPPFSRSRHCPRMMERSILIHYSLGSLLPNFFPLAPSLSILVTHFFLFSTKIPRAGKTTVKLIRPRWASWHCLSSPLSSIISQVAPDMNSFLSLDIREEEVITNLIWMPSNHLQHKAKTQIPGEIHSWLLWPSEHQNWGLFFHSQWVRFCYIERALRIAFKEGDMQGKGNTSMLSVVREHSFDHSILWSVQRNCWII